MCPLHVLSFLLLCGPRPSAQDSQQVWDGACTMRVGTSYCQVTGVIPKSSSVPCLHEETLMRTPIVRIGSSAAWC